MSNFLNLKEIDQEEALNLTKFFINSGQNIFLFGRRGTGKTEITFKAAQELKYKVNYINLSVIERPDLAGYPNINSPGEVITFKSPYFLPALLENNSPDTIILFDEVDKAPPEITAPLLEILQFRKINGKPLNVQSCVLTGNFLNEGAYSNAINTALLDRGAKFVLKFDFERWSEWAKVNNINDLILGFLRNNQELACGKIEDTSYASPSPRGWTLASLALDKAKLIKITDIDTVSTIISGYVGFEAGFRFKVWYEYFKKYEDDIQSIIDNKYCNLNFANLNSSEKVIFVIGCCQYAKQQAIKSKSKFTSLDNLCLFFDNYNVEKELQIMGLCNSFNFDLITKYKLYTSKSFFDLFTKLTQKLPIKK